MLTGRAVGGLYLLGRFCNTLSRDRPTDSCPFRIQNKEALMGL